MPRCRRKGLSIVESPFLRSGELSLGQMRSRPLSLLVILLTLAAGLAIRFASLGLPPVLTKYGGSAL